MKYSKGYKYQLKQDCVFQTPFRPDIRIEDAFIILERSGLMRIKKGYAWDGPSGPTYDDDIFLAGSLFHDPIYQLMRLGLLPSEDWRMADNAMKGIIKILVRRSLLGRSKFAQVSINAMWSARLVYIMAGLALAKGKAARPSSKKKIYEIAH